MLVGTICVRNVCCCDADTTAEQAAMMMRKAHVGDLVVVEANAQGERVPVGIVTDRDLIVEVMAQKINPAAITVGEFVMSDCLCVREDVPVFQAVEMMRKTGVRRLPVTNDADLLVGMVSIDDLIALIGRELSGLAQVAARQQGNEAAARG